MLPEQEGSRKDDLRVRRTQRALVSSMHSLLNEYRFSKLTVEKLCSEGQVSRATFYAHFLDKYDLLNFWLSSVWKYKATDADVYEKIRDPINQVVRENKAIIKNLLLDADHETLSIVLSFICDVLKIEKMNYADKETVEKSAVATNLYVGGIVSYLLWQARNDFPSNVPVINDYSFTAIKKLRDWAKAK